MQRRFSFLKLDFTMEEGMICTGNFFLVGSVIQLKFLAYHMVLEKKESGWVNLNYDIRHHIDMAFVFLCTDLNHYILCFSTYSYHFDQPWGNFPEKNPRYKQYLDENRLRLHVEDVWLLFMSKLRMLFTRAHDDMNTRFTSSLQALYLQRRCI